jgi:hypothetical protein
MSAKRNQVHKSIQERHQEEDENKTRKSLKLNIKGARYAADQEYKEWKKEGNEFLNSSFFVLELSLIAFPPQAPQKATRDHLPHDRTPRATTRPPASE